MLLYTSAVFNAVQLTRMLYDLVEPLGSAAEQAQRVGEILPHSRLLRALAGKK